MNTEPNKYDPQDPEQAAFESKLHHALQQRPAPLGLKQRVLATARERRHRQHGRLWIFQRLAATTVLAAAFAGFAAYRQHEEHQKEIQRGEEAREQVMTALRITNKTLDRVSTRLAENSR
jgi:hypothetical protein